MKTLIAAASLAAVLVSGCAEMRDHFADASAHAGATSRVDAATSANDQSPYPAETDEGIF